VTEVWPRPNYVVGGTAGEIALIALATKRLPDPLPISRGQHGMPDEGAGPESIALVARERAEDPTWFVVIGCEEHILVSLHRHSL